MLFGGIMGYVEIFKLVIQLLPSLIEAIKIVENALPESGKGVAKLDLVREILQVSYEAGGEGNFEHVWSVASKVVAGVVRVFNGTGVFSK